MYDLSGATLWKESWAPSCVILNLKSTRKPILLADFGSDSTCATTELKHAYSVFKFKTDSIYADQYGKISFFFKLPLQCKCLIPGIMELYCRKNLEI